MPIDLNIAIPLNRSVKGWKNITIHAIEEPMVILNDYAPNFLLVESDYYRQGIPGSLKECYSRKGLADLLVKAAKTLPDGFKFLIWDAWRPIEVQQNLFDAFQNKLKQETNLEGEALNELTQTYVSLPSTNINNPSPHLTGGAIDLTIIDTNGNPLNMGTDFDHFGEEAQTDYYETKLHLNNNQLIIRKNRRILYNSLTSVGFSNYPHEWWHFDYGNQFWGALTGKNAFYNKHIKT